MGSLLKGSVVGSFGVFGNAEYVPCVSLNTWWRHQMWTYSALLALRVGNSPITGEFPSQRPVTRSFYVFFDLRLNKRLHKQSRPETPWCSLLRHCNASCWTVILDVHAMSVQFDVAYSCNGRISFRLFFETFDIKWNSIIISTTCTW